MSPTVSYLSQRHRVVTVGSGAFDYIVLPNDIEEYKTLMGRFRGLRSRHDINPILSHVRNEEIKYHRLPGGTALTVSQYFAARKKEEGEEKTYLYNTDCDTNPDCSKHRDAVLDWEARAKIEQRAKGKNENIEDKE